LISDPQDFVSVGFTPAQADLLAARFQQMENTFAQRFTLLQETVNRGFADTAATLQGISRTTLVLVDRLERVEGKVDDLARDIRPSEREN
jgi:hypothetical protein